MAYGLMIFIFSCLILFGGALSIYGLIRGTTALWPAVVGLVFAIALMVGTFVGIATKWGGCSSTSDTSEGAITCVVGRCASGCNPDVWKVECKKQSACPAPSPAENTSKCGLAIPTPTPLQGPAPTPTPLAANAFCPRGQKPVYDFCEKMEAGGVKQPWATWSDLSFIAAGIWIFWLFKFFDRVGDNERWGQWLVPTYADNPMITIGPLSILYGLVVIFMGPPSMWYHASMKEWAGWFDSMSVVIWLFFNAVYVWYAICAAMWDRGRGLARTITVLCFWGSGTIVFGIIAAKFPHARLYLYFIAGGLWGLGEAIYLLISGVALGIKYRRTWWLFVTNFGLLGLTMGIWCLFNQNIVPYQDCISRESFPGHALFHILASVSTIVTYFSFASEKDESRTPVTTIRIG